MNMQLVTQHDVDQKQASIRQTYRWTQASFSVTGIRRLVGNTLIEMGDRIVGCRPIYHQQITQMAPTTQVQGA